MSKFISEDQQNYLEALRSEKDKFILEMEEWGSEKQVPIINWNAGNLLEHLILLHQPKRVLEIGTAMGYSGVLIARNLADDAKLDTVELSKYSIPVAKENMKKAGVFDKVEIHYGNALQILPRFKEKFDFIFLDADKKDYKKLFKLSLGLLETGGVMFVDNLLWQGYAAKDDLYIPQRFHASTGHIREFNKLFMSEESLKTSIYPVGDGVGIGIKIK